STLSLSLTYVRALVSSSLRVNTAVTGANSVTVIGSGAGLCDYTSLVRVSTAQEAGIWVSVSAIRIKVGSGSFAAMSFGVSIAAQSLSMTLAATYDASTSSSIARVNAAVTSSVSITLVGTNSFSLVRASSCVRSQSSAMATSWASTSALVSRA